MYNGIGLATARGSATSGHVTRNLSYVKPEFFRNKVDNNSGRNNRSDISSTLKQTADKDILDHNRKREQEAKIFEMTETMREQGYSEEEIEVQVRKLSAKSNYSSANKSITDSHEMVARKNEENQRLARAFGVDTHDYKEGAAFDPEYQQLKRQQREQERQNREQERQQREQERIQRDSERRAERAKRDVERGADDRRRDREGERDRDHDRDRHRGTERYRDRSGDRDRDRLRDRSRDGEKARNRDRSRDRERDRDRDQDRDRERDRDRNREKEGQKVRDSESAKDREKGTYSSKDDNNAIVDSRKSHNDSFNDRYGEGSSDDGSDSN